MAYEEKRQTLTSRLQLKHWNPLQERVRQGLIWLTTFPSVSFFNLPIQPVLLPPTVKYVPAWFPGAGFKNKAREWYELRREMTERPYVNAKEKIVSLFLSRLIPRKHNKMQRSGVYTPSLVSLALEKVDKSEDSELQEEAIKGAAATSYGGKSPVDFTIACTNFLQAVLIQ